MRLEFRVKLPDMKPEELDAVLRKQFSDLEGWSYSNGVLALMFPEAEATVQSLNAMVNAKATACKDKLPFKDAVLLNVLLETSLKV